MVSMSASSAVDRGLESLFGHTKDFKIGMHCVSAKYTALGRKVKYWLGCKQDNVSKWAKCLFADCCISELAL